MLLCAVVSHQNVVPCLADVPWSVSLACANSVDTKCQSACMRADQEALAEPARAGHFSWRASPCKRAFLEVRSLTSQHAVTVCFVMRKMWAYFFPRWNVPQTIAGKRGERWKYRSFWSFRSFFRFIALEPAAMLASLPINEWVIIVSVWSASLTTSRNCMQTCAWPSVFWPRPHLESDPGSVANLAVFPRIWACFFMDLRFVWRLAGCLFLGLFWLKFACFLQISVVRIAFFSNLMAILLFQCTAKRNLDVFLGHPAFRVNCALQVAWS